MSPSTHVPPTFPASTWTPTHISSVSYGTGALSQLSSKIMPTLPKGAILLLTGRSLSQSEIIESVKKELGDRLVMSSVFIGQHAPLTEIKEALKFMTEKNVKSIVTFGGGSVIDSGKALSYFYQKDNGEYLPQVAIPTTLSAAEGTAVAGFTGEDGRKTGVGSPEIVPKYIIYDPAMTVSTPEKLWLSTGIRALDHAVEALYRPSATPISRTLALAALRDLFIYLPKCKAEPKDLSVRAALQVACWQSLGNEVVSTALGVSHALGHQLGATYSIPHGITSCITLSGTIRVITSTPGALSQRDIYDLHLAVSHLPAAYTSDYTTTHGTLIPGEEDGLLLGRAVAKLIADLGLASTLEEYKVPEADLDGLAESALKELRGWTDDRKPKTEDVIKMLKTGASGKPGVQTIAAAL